MEDKEQMKAVILEECVLFLLRASGYRTILEAGNEAALEYTSEGLAVRGRGCLHQINAVADFTFRTPFSYPNRLLVETKGYDGQRPVGLQTIQNAAGVLKDVNEFWGEAPISRKRYNYQYAVISSTPFTREAQAFAFAQDVYLLPLGASSHLRDLLHYIGVAAGMLVDEQSMCAFRERRGLAGESTTSTLREVRSILRHIFQPLPERGFPPPDDVVDALEFVIQTTFHFRELYIGVLTGGLSLLLAPHPGRRLNGLQDEVYMRLVPGRTGMLLESVPDGLTRFSFDLPAECFLRLEASGAFVPATEYHSEWEPEIDIFLETDGRSRVAKIFLQSGWVDTLKEWAMSVKTASESDLVDWIQPQLVVDEFNRKSGITPDMLF